MQKLILDKETLVVTGICSGLSGEDLTLVDVPDGYSFDDNDLWFYDKSEEAVVRKKGKELQIALAKRKKPMQKKLMQRYFGNSITPGSQGDFEKVVDLLLQVTIGLMNGTLTLAQKAKFQALFNTVEPTFLLKLENGNQKVWNTLAERKTDARQRAVKMKQDPEWPGNKE